VVNEHKVKRARITNTEYDRERMGEEKTRKKEHEERNQKRGGGKGRSSRLARLSKGGGKGCVSRPRGEGREGEAQLVTKFPALGSRSRRSFPWMGGG